jgi:hypothetical protein
MEVLVLVFHAGEGTQTAEKNEEDLGYIKRGCNPYSLTS